MAQLSIMLLGTPAVARNAQPVSGFISGKALALVCYLAATGRSHARGTLAALLWPEAAEAQAQKNLRDVLSNLRRLLDPHLLVTRQTVGLDMGAAAVDSRRFEALVEAAARATSPADEVASLRQAVELYRGDFLDGVFVAQAAELEEWATIERERLRQLFLNALHRLIARALERGAYLEGVDYATRLLAIEPWQEEAHRQLMLLLALGGQRGAALAHYDVCRRMLDEQLGVEPDEATTELYEQILAGEVGQVARAALPQAGPYQMVPLPLTAFVGRAAELAHVVALLGEPACRLVTITGAGGVGKTSLALQAARRLLEAGVERPTFTHGAAFVALGALEAVAWGDPAGAQAAAAAIAGRIADTLNLTCSGPEPLQVQLAGYVREKELLLVLDNLEQLLPAASALADLLQQAPGLKILATSRGRLNLRGEQVVALDGLPVLSEQDGGAGRDDALSLFVQVAQAADPQFDLAGGRAAQAARICRLVDGLPLGIELAASMVRLMPCEEIAHEIASNLSFLQSSQRDTPERHQSLHAVFDHSWQLLSDAERAVLGRLAVFRGGFTRAAAQQVAGATLAALAALADNSLVRRGAPGQQDAGRYDLLEAVRQYAAEQLGQAPGVPGAEQRATRDRHARFYLEYVGQRQIDLRGARQQAAVAEISQEDENIRAAWRWAVAEGQVESIGLAVEGLFRYYEMRSWFLEGAETFGLAAERLAGLHAAAPGTLTGTVWGKLLARQGWLLFQLGRPTEARELLDRSLALLQEVGDQADLIFPLTYLASAACHGGAYDDAWRFGQAGLNLSAARGDRYGVVITKTILGQIAYHQGRYEQARQLCEESLAIERELENRWGIAFTLIVLGTIARALRDYHAARRYLQEALAIREALNDARGIALCLSYLGDIAAALEDHAEAARLFQTSLALFQDIGNQGGVSAALNRLGASALAVGDNAAARGYFLDALRSSQKTRFLPHTLDALAGLAAVLTTDNPARAATLALAVVPHPTATEESRARAQAVLAAFAPEQLDPQPATASLDGLVERMLWELARE